MNSIHKIIKEREKRPGTSKGKNISVRTIAQESKETRVGMKDGNGINLCSVYPANNPYIIRTII